MKKYFLSHTIKWCWKRQYLKQMRISLLNQINPHVAILGQTGTGKSNACKKLLCEIAQKGISLLVFDAHNEYVGMADLLHAKVYDAASEGVNALDIEGESKEKAGEVAEMLRRILRLGYRQYNVLYRLLLYTYDYCEGTGRKPSMNNLLYSVRVFKRHAMKSELSILNTLETRLMLLYTERNAGVDVSAVMRSNSIFALSQLHTTEAQALFVESFLRRIYQIMLISEKRALPRLCIVIEEAEKLSGSKLLSRVTAEGRKYGIGIVAISQRAKALDREIMSNAGMILAFYQREPEELNYLANVIAGGNEYQRFAEVKKALRNLGRGYAIVLCSRQEPVIARLDFVSGGTRNLEFEIALRAKKAVRKAELLDELAKLGFAAERVEERLVSMLSSGSLGSYEVDAGKYSDTWYVTSPKNSAEHDIMLQVISSYMKENGVPNKIYDSAYMPDIVAFDKGKRIAVEYETGKKEVAETARMLRSRRNRYSKILVVVNEEHLEQYRTLAIEGTTVVGAADFMGRNAPLI